MSAKGKKASYSKNLCAKNKTRAIPDIKKVSVRESSKVCRGVQREEKKTRNTMKRSEIQRVGQENQGEKNKGETHTRQKKNRVEQ